MGDLDFYTVPKGDFSAGELSPFSQGDVEDPAYKAGSSLVYNMIPVGKYLRRRPGSRYIDSLTAQGMSGNVRKVPFTAVYGQKFALVIGAVSGVAKILVYSQATRALVATIATNVPAWAQSDILAINYAQQNGQTWLFMSGTAAGTPGGTNVVYVSNGASDGSGAWSCTVPAFVNDTSGAGLGEKFNAANHYPGCGEFYAGRLFVSGCNFNPFGVYACALIAPPGTQQYLVFTITGTPGNAITDGIYLLQNDMNASAIRWMLAAQTFLAGTDQAIWMEQSEPYPTGATFGLRKSANHGTLAYTRPVQLTNVVLYLGAAGKSLRSLILSLYRGFFADENQSWRADHLMSRVAVDFAVIVKPEPQAWILMSDGTFLVASVKQEDTGFVVKAGCGFSQQALGGSGVAKTILGMPNTLWDEVWFTVNRGGTLTLEYVYLDDLNTTAQGDSFYVDCGYQWTGASTTTPGGLPAVLNGVSCWGLGNGGVMKNLVPSAGSVTTPSPVTKLNIGQPYYSAWQDIRPSIPGKGSSQMKIKKLEATFLRLVNSLGAWIGQTPPADPLNHPESTLSDLWAQMQTFGVQLYGSAPAMVSGDFQFEHSEAADRDARTYLVIADPVPFNMTLVSSRITMSEL